MSMAALPHLSLNKIARGIFNIVAVRHQDLEIAHKPATEDIAKYWLVVQSLPDNLGLELKDAALTLEQVTKVSVDKEQYQKVLVT